MLLHLLLLWVEAKNRLVIVQEQDMMGTNTHQGRFVEPFPTFLHVLAAHKDLAQTMSLLCIFLSPLGHFTPPISIALKAEATFHMT